MAKSKSAKRVQSWGDIDPKVIQAFIDKVELLQEEMIPRDCDNTSPIQVVIVNRLKQDYFHFTPVPRTEVYSYKTHSYVSQHPDKQQELDDEAEKWMLSNLEVAQSMLSQHFRFKHECNRRDRVSRLPFPERIADACHLCRDKTPYAPLDAVDDYFFKKYGADFPSRYHIKYALENGEKVSCEAYKIRREQFYQSIGHKIEPEPRYCTECRSLLPSYNSKKGAKDKYICVICGTNNQREGDFK